MPNGIPDHVGVDVEIGAEPNDESVDVLLAKRCDDVHLELIQHDADPQDRREGVGLFERAHS